MEQDHNANPFNSVPAVVVILALAMFAIEMVLELAGRGILGGPAGIGWRIEAFNALAFSPDLLEYAWKTGNWDMRNLSRLVTYSFVHTGFTHMLFVAVFILALGKMVAEIFHPLAVLVLFFGSAAAGAVIYTLVLPDRLALVGGFPAAYGIIGAYTYMMWTGLGAMGMNRLRAFQLIGLLMGVQLVFGLLFGTTNAWVAELGGFVTGFGLSFVISPGGFSRVRARLRHR